MSPQTLFLTGATGFVGRHVVTRLDSARFPVVRCLVRPGAADAARDWNRPGLDIISGTLEDPASYALALADADVVLHLAAITGRASPRTYRRINVDGTRQLLATGRARFVFVSSIAVAFSRTRAYHYARSKREAEALVRASGHNHVIVRPTMVFGPGSPVAEKLSRLASSRVVFGNGRVLVQPIDVGDLADLLVTLAATNLLPNDVVEAGGPDVIALDALLAGMRRSAGAAPATFFHLPARPIIEVLALIEGLGLRCAPVHAGQLASFVNDSTADPARRPGQLPDQLKSLETMLRCSRGEPAMLERPMDERLARECLMLTRYLSGSDPTAAVVHAYQRAHALGVVGARPARFDRLLTALAGRHPSLTRAVDSYATALARNSTLRRKLVLLLAILESSWPACETIDLVSADSAGGIAWRIVVATLRHVALATGGALLLTPLRVGCFLADRIAPPRESSRAGGA